MAWEAITKAEVSDISGAREGDIADVYYEMAVALLEYAAGMYNIGNLTAVTDTIDGTGTKRVALPRSPVNSVTSVSVDDVVLDSSTYTHDDRYVILIDDFTTNPYALSDAFPVGSKNVSVSYVSGESSNKLYGLAVALIVTELIRQKVGEAADARVQFGSTNRSDARSISRKYVGVHTRLMEIVNTLFGRRTRMA